MCAHLCVELLHVVPALAHDEGTQAAVHRPVIAHQAARLEGVIGLGRGRGGRGSQREHTSHRGSGQRLWRWIRRTLPIYVHRHIHDHHIDYIVDDKHSLLSFLSFSLSR